jgi:hypothetical protein
MKTHKGNVSKVVADIGEVTIDTLKKFNIQYDELCFGKPYADFYIDDLAINPLRENLQKSTGFYFSNVTETRPFNNIQITNEKVVKTGNVGGEIFWYKNCPAALCKKFFPEIYSLEDTSIEMQKIKGLSLSYLYTNNLLTDVILDKVFESLKEIHNYENSISGDFNKNYFTKISTRFKDNQKLYSQLDNAQLILKDLHDFFKNYTCNSGCIIHGDPVFSNTFFTTDEEIKFIDVRGKNGGEYSLYGDKLYDYAKVYQSILGYDYILHGKTVNSHTVEKFKNLFINKMYATTGSEQAVYNIRQITKSLLFSLLPLHSDNDKVREYYKLISMV